MRRRRCRTRSRSTSDLPAQAKQLCADNRATSIYGGTLSLQQAGGAFTRTATANFELLRYDCSGSVTARERVATQATGRSNDTVAIDRAIAKSLDAALHPAPVKHT